MVRSKRAAMALGAGLMLIVASCGGGGSASTEEFCDLAERADRSGDDVDEALTSGDPKEIEDAMTDALDDAKAAVDAAPDDIKDAAKLVADAQTDFVDILAEYDFDIEAAVADADLAAVMEDTDVEAASDELDEYLADECGIEDDDAAGASTEGSTDANTATDEGVVTDTSTAVAAVDTTVAAVSDTLELDAEVGGTTVGTTDDPTVVYAAVITNTTDDPASNLTLNFTIFDATDQVVGTGTGYIDLILPGQTRAVASSTSVTAAAARIEANYSGDVGMPYGITDAELPVGEFTFEGTQLKQDDYSIGALGLLKSSYTVNLSGVETVIVFRDAAGSIIGGGTTYVDVPANGQVGVEPTSYYVIPEVATFDLYAAYSVYSLGD